MGNGSFALRAQIEVRTSLQQRSLLALLCGSQSCYLSLDSSRLGYQAPVE